MKKLLNFATMFACLVVPQLLHAGSGWFTTSGERIAWSGTNVNYHPEAGACGTFTNSQMLTELDNYLGLWSASNLVGIAITMVPGELPDVTGDNYSTYSEGSGANDDIHNVIFDDDGAIIEAIGGEGSVNSILGFAGPSAQDSVTGVITDGEMVMNCRCLEGHASGSCADGFTFNETTLFTTLSHEFGHFLGMDHSQVNRAAYDSESTDDNTVIPLMYPTDFSVSAIALTTDDIVSMASVYPSSVFTTEKCTVTGSLTDSSGAALRCADVQAVPADVAHTVAFVSGAGAVATDNNADGDTVDDGECASGCGDFTLHLTPGTSYSLNVAAIDPSFTGGSSVGPCSNEQLTTIIDQTIAEIDGSSCVAGQTLNLGTLSTTSTGGTTETGTSGTSGTSGSSGSGSSSSCSLNPATSSQSNSINHLWMLLTPLVLMLLRRGTKSQSI